MGVAYQGLGQHENALIAFAEGLAADPKQSSALVGLVDAMLKSPLKGKGERERERERQREEEEEGETEGGRERSIIILKLLLKCLVYQFR